MARASGRFLVMACGGVVVAIASCVVGFDGMPCRDATDCASPAIYCIQGSCSREYATPGNNWVLPADGGEVGDGGDNSEPADPVRLPDGGEVYAVKVAGRFCVEDPSTVTLPVKIWFVIDDSGSMATSDPSQNRYNSIRALATQRAAPGTLFFGGMTFAGDGATRFSTPRFNDDVATFNSQVPTSPGSGQTPYYAALDMTASELNSDIDENQSTAVRTRYVVVFLTDGMPTVPAGTTEQEVLAKVGRIMALGSRAGGVTFNTVYLGGGDSDAGQGLGLLEAMATLGKGAFKSFPNGNALDFGNLDSSSIQAAWEPRLFVVTNRSMMPTAEGQEVDSDRDGLDDAREAELRTDPKSADTDGDGCGDLIEVRLQWNPLAQVAGECTCAAGKAQLDTDDDGLNDCEEQWTGTHARNPDSDIGRDSPIDGDLIPDGLDFTVMDATYANTGTDWDHDGVLDIDEVRAHTSTSLVDLERSSWAYRYSVIERESPDSGCYGFEVKNIALGNTLAVAGRAAGENVIELFVAESMRDDPRKDLQFRVARKIAPYIKGNVLTVSPADFDRVLRPK